MIWKYLAEGFGREDLVLKEEIRMRTFLNIAFTLQIILLGGFF